MDITIQYPNLIEQEKIGSFLSAIDRLIEKQREKVDRIKSLKKGYLQRMFPARGEEKPKFRFKGFSEKWIPHKLGEVVSIQRGGSPRPINQFITEREDGINWIKIGDVSNQSRYITSTQEKITPEGAKSSRSVFKGDLILSNSMSFGRPYILTIDGCIHDGWLLIRNDKNTFHLEFLLQLLSSNLVLEQYKSFAAGGVVNNLNSDLVQKVIVSFPPRQEQEKIANFFIKIEDILVKNQKQLESYEQMKKSYLQRIFAN
jgi:restriction endonuclease S subunit